MKDDWGDRLKAYEMDETRRRFDPGLPLVVRIDGRGFSKFTRDMVKPFDGRLSDAMIETTRALVANSHADLGYTQSDEITLVYRRPSDDAEFFFGGKVHKITSVLPSLAASAFTLALTHGAWDEALPLMALLRRLPHFDARAFQLPDEDEVANAVLWRVRDGERNAVQSAAHAKFGHDALERKSKAEKLDMLAGAGVDLEREFPPAFSHGTMVRRVRVDRVLTEEQLALIPEDFRPSDVVLRYKLDAIPLPEKITHAFVREVVFGPQEST